MPQTNLQRQIKVKVQSDTDQHLAKFRDNQRKLKIQAGNRKAEKKEFRAEATPDRTATANFLSGGVGITMVMGLTLSLVNDFSDLVLWQKMSLISQTLDITTLIMVLLMVMFSSRAYFFSVFIMLFVFLLEIMPILGVIPLWTFGMAAWYVANRRK